MGFSYIDSTPIDDGSPYYVGWDSVDFGASGEKPPTKTDTTLGFYVVYPIKTNYQDRKGRFGIYAYSLDFQEKLKIESEIRELLNGQKKLHVGSRYLNVTFFNANQASDDTRKAARIAGVEAEFIAYDPFWYLNQPLNGIASPVNVGDEWGLYDDNAVPVILPDYIFDTNSLTFNNWGTAPAMLAGTVTDGPAGDGVNPTIYLTGPSDYKKYIVLSAGGDGSFTATPEFYANPGNNTIEVRKVSDGTLISPSGTFSLDFGNTYMRFR